MRVGKRLFPYPTINNSKLINNFKLSSFALEYEDPEDKEFYLLKNVHVSMNNPEIIELIRQNKAEAVLVVECSSTIFRKTYIIDLEPIDIQIPLDNLRGKVVISSFIYAKEKIDNFLSNDFLDDYEGYSFEIEKYYILAIDDGFTTKIEYDENQDKKVSSIFRVIRSEEDLRSMKIKSVDRNILIYLPAKQFDYYDNLRRNDNFQNIFFSIVAIPALIFCLKELQDEGLDIETIKLEHSWFYSIINGYQKLYGEELTEEIFTNLNVSVLSQELLDNGSIKAIEDFFNIVTGNIMIGGAEDE